MKAKLKCLSLGVHQAQNLGFIYFAQFEDDPQK